ncbi:MAG: hypothetical protein Kow00128_00130 [Deltaproteobacteria bacterium]
MRKGIRALLLPVAVLLLAGAGCVTGKVLYLSGDLYRPGTGSPGPPAEGAEVAVLDFAYAGTPPYEIGRDFDHARSIVWKGDPGKSLADLIADALRERGIPVVRAASDADLPRPVSARVWGRVDELRVSTKKTGSLRLTVEVAASVKATLHASGGNAPQGWSSSLSSDFVSNEPLFTTAGSVHEGINAAANAVAGEAVKRLVAAGVIR